MGWMSELVCHRLLSMMGGATWKVMTPTVRKPVSYLTFYILCPTTSLAWLLCTSYKSTLGTRPSKIERHVRSW